MLGLVLDGLGQPIDGYAPPIRPPPADRGLAAERDAAPAHHRPRPALGVRAPRHPHPLRPRPAPRHLAGSGVGKSSLLGMIARSTTADVNVYSAWSSSVAARCASSSSAISAKPSVARSSWSATGDQPALVRIKAALTATGDRRALPRRGQGRDADDGLLVTRFVAMAQREVGLAIGEPPATRVYTPSVFAMAAAPLGAQRHERRRLDHGALHHARRRRRHERADRRRVPRSLTATSSSPVSSPTRGITRRSTCSSP